MRPSCCSDSRPSQPLQHHDNSPGVAAALLTGQQLQGVSVILHGVVPRHSPAVLETQDLLHGQISLQGPECRLGAPGRDPKTPVEPGQELLQHGLGLFNGGCSCKPRAP